MESIAAASSRLTSNFASGGSVTLAGGFFFLCICQSELRWGTVTLSVGAIF
jgi:hypothetical protein